LENSYKIFAKARNDNMDLFWTSKMSAYKVQLSRM
jgi:hypothetical protein